MDRSIDRRVIAWTHGANKAKCIKCDDPGCVTTFEDTWRSANENIIFFCAHLFVSLTANGTMTYENAPDRYNPASDYSFGRLRPKRQYRRRKHRQRQQSETASRFGLQCQNRRRITRDIHKHATGDNRRDAQERAERHVGRGAVADGVFPVSVRQIYRGSHAAAGSY